MHKPDDAKRIEYLVRLPEREETITKEDITSRLSAFETIQFKHIPYIGVRTYSEKEEKDLTEILDAIPGVQYEIGKPRKALDRSNGEYEQ